MIQFLHPKNLTPECLAMADALETAVRAHYPGVHKIEIHSDWNVPGTGGHVTESQHFSGNALDLHIEGLTLLQQWVVASRVPSIRGLGGYPSWASPGIHADCRQTPERALWWRDASGSYDHPMDEFFKLVAR
jgi:hypothetical protein